MLKTITLILSLSLNIFLTIIVFSDDSDLPSQSGVIYEDAKVKEARELELASEEGQLDKQKWSAMKGLMAGAELFYTKKNTYPKNLAELKPYLDLPKNLEAGLETMFTYAVMADSQGKEGECYEVSTSYETEYYKKHHNEKSVFSVGNKGRGLC